MAPADLGRQIHEMADKCQPALPDADNPGEVENIIAQAITGEFKLYVHGRMIGNQTVADWFDITLTEADGLESLPPATRFGGAQGANDDKLTKPQHRQARRAALQQLIRPGYPAPPLRTIQEELANVGLATTITTIGRDLDALQIPRQGIVHSNRSRPDPVLDYEA